MEVKNRKRKKRDESEHEEKIDYMRILKIEGGNMEEYKLWQN
jgi:hypothetical protein